MNRFLYICLLFTGLILSSYQSIVSAQSSDWVYSPYAQYLTNDTTISPPVGEPADAALSCFRHDTVYVLVMPTGQLYIWLRPDPLMDKYIQSSPYAYCNGNPLKYVDPNGETIKGATEEDITTFIDDVKFILSDEKFSKFTSLLSAKKEKIKKLNNKDIQTALHDVDLNESKACFINRLTWAINSADELYVEYLSGIENCSDMGLEAINGTMPYMVSVNQIFLHNFGGAVTAKFYGGSYSIISNDNTTDIRPITSMHEVLGHGIAFCMGLFPEQNNSVAIQVTNMVNRILNLPLWNGYGHQTPYANPYLIPKL